MSEGKQSTKRVLISFDYAFKKLLRNKANYDVLEGFLSELLERDVTVKNLIESESNKENKEDKQNRVDILVEDQNGEILIIELQFALELDYLQRIVFGISKVIVEQLQEGDKYMNIKKVYSISIVYFNYGEGDDYVYHGTTSVLGKHTGEELRLSKLQQELFNKEFAREFYPELYILRVNCFDNRAKNKLDEWIYFFKNNEIKDEFTAKGLEKAKEVLIYDNLSLEEKKDYDNMRRVRSENKSTFHSAIDTGKAEGKAEGIAEGIEIGKAEEKERVVVESFKTGLSYEIISAITKLSQEEIISILKKNKLI